MLCYILWAPYYISIFLPYLFSILFGLGLIGWIVLDPLKSGKRKNHNRGLKAAVSAIASLLIFLGFALAQSQYRKISSPEAIFTAHFPNVDITSVANVSGYAVGSCDIGEVKIEFLLLESNASLLTEGFKFVPQDDNRHKEIIAQTRQRQQSWSHKTESPTLPTEIATGWELYHKGHSTDFYCLWVDKSTGLCYYYYNYCC